MAYGHTDVLLNRPAIAPLGEARPNTQIFRDLARAWGFTTLLFRQTTKPCAARPMAPVDFQQLLDAGLPRSGLPDAPFADGGFPTPSGKCEFFSERLARQGLDGLPDHLPNHEPAGSSARYPLAMISPPARNFLNSSFVNVTSLRSIEGEPVLEIHAADAAARGIATAPWCGCSTTGATYRCKAEVSARARPGVVNGLGIWWRKLGLDGTNVNQLTSQKLTDLGRGPVFYDCLVEVQLPAVQPALVNAQGSGHGARRWGLLAAVPGRTVPGRLRQPGLLLAVGQRPSGADERGPPGGQDWLEDAATPAALRERLA
jgi:anaerobic selenocysteine-containing dehydrogenase